MINPPHQSLTVLKLGGSLFPLSDLRQRLHHVIELAGPSPTLLVPGGGAFADAVRQLDRVHHWPASVSHQLALQAMSCAAHAVAALSSRLEIVTSLAAVPDVLKKHRIPLLDVRTVFELNALPASWDVTSDSIAAWVTGWFASNVALLAGTEFAPRLWLVKSVDLPNPVPTAENAAAAGLVDRYFPEIARSLSKVDWINLRASDPSPSPWLSGPGRHVLDSALSNQSAPPF